jgi:hypothetical protein
MKEACERCAAPLSDGSAAYVCSYECTFCDRCTSAMEYRCPNCGGELVQRKVKRQATTFAEAARELALLQVAATHLPAVAPGSRADSPAMERRALASFMPFNEHSFVFDPFGRVELPVTATIHDDLNDIYNDLQEGLLCYRDARYADALWHWRSSYYIHWGRHVVQAQVAIWNFLAFGNEGI